MISRVWHIGFLTGSLVMWGAYPIIDTDRQTAAIWVFCAATVAFAGASFLIANQRRYVVCTLAYLVTGKRAIICRRGANWRLTSGSTS